VSKGNQSEIPAEADVKLAISCLVYSSTLKIEAICSSETSGFDELHGARTQRAVLFSQCKSQIQTRSRNKYLREHKRALGHTNCFFKAELVLELSIFSWVFQHPVVPEADIEKLVWLSGFSQFFSMRLTSPFDIINIFALGCLLLTH
jgi:hypothetical protein